MAATCGPQLGCVVWTFQAPGPVTTSPVTGLANTIYLACETGVLQALYKNGDQRWAFDTGSPLVCSPAVTAAGEICCVNSDGMVHMLTPIGTLSWIAEVEGPVYASPVIDNFGNVFVGAMDGRIHAFAPNGTEIWNFQTAGLNSLPGAIVAPPSLGLDGAIYIGGCFDPNIYALDSTTGTILWAHSFQIPPDPCAIPGTDIQPQSINPPIVGPDGTLYVALIHDLSIHALDPNDGSLIWTHTFDNLCLANDAQILTPPAIGPDGTIYLTIADSSRIDLDNPPGSYFTETRSVLYALNPDGSDKWSTYLSKTGGCDISLGADGLIYATGEDAVVHVLDNTGRIISRFYGQDTLHHSLIDPLGRLLIVTESGKLSVIKPHTRGCTSFDLHRPSDLNGDMQTNLSDFLLISERWGQQYDRLNPTSQPPPWTPEYSWYALPDINHDFLIDSRDVVILAETWLSQD